MPLKKAKRRKGEVTKKPLSAKTPDQQILYIELDEEVATVIDRVRQLVTHQIVLVIPSGSLLLGSAVNLKLLAQQIQKLGKELIIVTKDKKGKRIASALGIQILNDVTSVRPKADTKETRAIKSRQPHKKEYLGSMTISDVIKRQRLSDKTRGTDGSRQPSPDELDVIQRDSFPYLPPNKKLLFVFVLVTLMLIGTVFALVVPNITIILEPKADTIEYLTNVTLADAKLNFAEIREFNTNIVPSYELEAKGSKRHTYKTTGVASTGANAKGYVTIINNTSINWPLVATTRLRSSDGIIFRLQKGVIVPAYSRVRAPVIADPIDELGKVVGERGNIGPSEFTIPGLRESNRKVVYAKSTDSMTGGVTEAARVASSDDINAAKDDIVNRLTRELSEILKQQAMAKSTDLGVRLEFLQLADSASVEIVEVGIDNSIDAGAPVLELTAHATTILRGVAFEKDRFYEILRRGLTSKIHPNMQLRMIDFDNINYRLLDKNDVLKKIKLETNVRGVVEYDIIDHYADKIKESLAGHGLSEAKEYLQAQDFIARARFQMWPFWLKKLPSVQENIRIVVKND